MEQESRYVYHGSTQQGLKTIRKNISSHGNHGYMEHYRKQLRQFLSVIRDVISIIL